MSLGQGFYAEGSQNGPQEGSEECRSGQRGKSQWDYSQGLGQSHESSGAGTTLQYTVKFPAPEGWRHQRWRGGLGGTPQCPLHVGMGKSLLEASICCDCPRREDKGKPREPQIQGHWDGLTLKEVPSVEPWGGGGPTCGLRGAWVPWQSCHWERSQGRCSQKPGEGQG